MTPFIKTLLRLLFPKLPAWLAPVIVGTIELVIDLVQDLPGRFKGWGKDKREAYILQKTKEYLDNSLDTLPGWGELTEERRDVILAGLINLGMFIADIAEDGDVDEPNVVMPEDLEQRMRQALSDRDKPLVGELQKSPHSLNERV